MNKLKHYSTDLACALKGYRALIVPGIKTAQSSKTNWLTLWEQHLPRANRIRLHDWQNADWVKWRNSIIASLISIDEPLVIIAEGFGALAAASIAIEYPSKIIAILLVDPANPDDADVRKKIPKKTLPVPTHMIVSTYLTATDSTATAHLAKLWGAEFNCTPTQATSDFWPEAIEALTEFLATTQRTQQEMMKIYRKKLPRHHRIFPFALAH